MSSAQLSLHKTVDGIDSESTTPGANTPFGSSDEEDKAEDDAYLKEDRIKAPWKYETD